MCGPTLSPRTTEWTRDPYPIASPHCPPPCLRESSPHTRHRVNAARDLARSQRNPLRWGAVPAAQPQNQREEAKYAGRRNGDRSGVFPQRHPAMKRGPWPEENSHTPPAPQSAPSLPHTAAPPETEKPLRQESGSGRKRRCSTRAPVRSSEDLLPSRESPHRSSDARGAPMRHAPHDDNNIPRRESNREIARRASRSAPRHRGPEGGGWPAMPASLRRKCTRSPLLPSSGAPL